ncbi:hypothetical protein, partial [Aquipuribacter sp. SD81]|uniref:hypothetical protein n=1 Tax=Aquipuribacter sp. SD81 TaxID=3127703 RepID=UPI003016A664
GAPGRDARGVPPVVPALAGAAAVVSYASRVLPAQRAAADGTAGSARSATMTGLKAFVLLQAGLLAGLGRPLQALGVLGLGRTGRLLARFGSPT